LAERRDLVVKAAHRIALSRRAVVFLHNPVGDADGFEIGAVIDRGDAALVVTRRVGAK
jgi:hypothetical protein